MHTLSTTISTNETIPPTPLYGKTSSYQFCFISIKKYLHIKRIRLTLMHIITDTGNAYFYVSMPSWIYCLISQTFSNIFQKFEKGYTLDTFVLKNN